MFAPSGGVPEDPATGSATAVLAAQLLASGALEQGANRFRLEQGYEMGRPSNLQMTADVEAGGLVSVRVAGEAVRVIVSEKGHKLILDDEANEVTLVHGSGPEIRMTASEIVLTCGPCEIKISNENISLNQGLIKVGLAGVSLVNGAMSFGVPP